MSLLPGTVRSVTEQRRPRGRPRAGLEPASIEAVLDAALAAFAKHGYDGMSMRTLCRELGVSHSLLNQRFGSKDGLWRAAADYGFGGLVRHLESGIDPTVTDPFAQLHRAIRHFVEFSARRPELGAIINAEGVAPSERLDYVYDTYIAPALAPAGALLEHLEAHGLIRPIPLRTFHVLVTSAGSAPFTLVALAQRIDPASPFDPDEVQCHARLIADIIVDGLRLSP